MPHALAAIDVTEGSSPCPTARRRRPPIHPSLGRFKGAPHPRFLPGRAEGAVIVRSKVGHPRHDHRHGGSAADPCPYACGEADCCKGTTARKSGLFHTKVQLANQVSIALEILAQERAEFFWGARLGSERKAEEVLAHCGIACDLVHFLAHFSDNWLRRGRRCEQSKPHLKIEIRVNLFQQWHVREVCAACAIEYGEELGLACRDMRHGI